MAPAPTVPIVLSRRALRSFREFGASSRERNVASRLTQPDGRTVPGALLAIPTMASLINCALRSLQERSHRSAVAGRGNYDSTRHQDQDISIELSSAALFRQ